MRKVTRALAVTSAACLALAAASFGCFSEREDVTAASGECRVPLNAQVVGTVVVAIQNFAFLPANLRIKRGATVTWVNCEPGGIDPHSSTSDGGVWDSGLIPPGGTYSRTFDVVGTFPYHCVPHPFMRATVTVE